MKAVLITGAARRIGKVLALGLAADGWDIAIHYNRSADEAEATAAEAGRYGVRTTTVGGDLSRADVLPSIVGQASAALGGLTALINNASLFEPDELHSLTSDGWSHHLDTNLRAPVFLSQAFAAQLPKGADGNIINMIDNRVLRPNPLFFSYTVSKAALWTATQTLAQALAPRIRVNAIGPGPTLPSSRMTDKDLNQQAALTLLERRIDPQEILATVRYILSQPALTGQMIALDSGSHLFWRTDDVLGVKE